VCYPELMRVLWSLLILLSVLAPAGQFGITQAPSDTVQLTAPTGRSAPVQRRLDLDQDLQLDGVLAPIPSDPRTPPPSPVTFAPALAVAPARTFVSSASQRGPPA